MSYYNIRSGLHRSPISVFAVKLALVCLGLLIGMSMGLYVAARILPLPNTTTIYITK